MYYVYMVFYRSGPMDNEFRRYLRDNKGILKTEV